MFHMATYVLAIFSLSQSPVLIKLSGIPPLALGYWRLLAAAVILLGIRSFKNSPNLILKNILGSRYWIIFTGFFFFLHLWSYSYSAQTTSVAHCMILFALNPLFTALGAKIFFKEPLEKNVIVSYVFAFVGLYILLHNKFSIDLMSWKGEFCALISGLLYSFYTLFSKRSRIEINNWDFGIGVYFVCSLCFLLTSFAYEVPLSGYSNVAWFALIGTVFIPTLLGHSLFTYLVKYLNINWMSCGKLLEPTISTIIAYFVFKETISIHTVIAFVCTSMAVLFLFFKLEHKGSYRIKILLRNK